MKPYQIIFALPFALAFGLVAHVLVAKGVKVILWAWAPLASGEPEAASYERKVYHTADKSMMLVVAAAALAGLPWLAALAAGGLWWMAGFLCVGAVVVLDVLWWERVAISAHYLWFQRGFRGKVHQVALENVRDGSIEETEVRGFTLRHGRENRLVRLQVRMADKRVIALPKTDGHNGFASVESVGNFLRMRLQQMRDQETQRERRVLRSQLDLPPHTPPEIPNAADDELQRELAKLRLAAVQKRPTH